MQDELNKAYEDMFLDEADAQAKESDQAPTLISESMLNNIPSSLVDVVNRHINNQQNMSTQKAMQATAVSTSVGAGWMPVSQLGGTAAIAPNNVFSGYVDSVNPTTAKAFWKPIIEPKAYIMKGRLPKDATNKEWPNFESFEIDLESSKAAAKSIADLFTNYALDKLIPEDKKKICDHILAKCL